MSPISITKLYDLLSIKVGRETAENLTSFIEEKIKDEFENKVEILATKTDIAEVKHEMASNRADMMKWMFIFWASQLIASFSFILLYLKK